MFLTEWKIIVSLNLIVSSVCSPDCEFEFLDLRDKTRVTSSGDRTIIVKFKVAQPCISSTKNLTYLIGKEESRGVRSNCVLRPADKYCQGDCKCPEDGSGVYSLELLPDPTYNGTWRWSSKPHVVRDHRMDIIIESIDAQTEKTTTKINTVKTRTADASETLLSSSSTNDPAEIKPGDDGSDNHYEAAFFLSLPGIILLNFNGVIIVSVISLVIVVVKRRGRRLRLSLQRDIPLQELQQDRQQLVPPLAHQQRQLPDIPGQQHVPPQRPTPLVLMRSGPGGRRYWSQESNFYEIIDDDERNDEGVRASASAPDLRASNQCADYLHPIPSRQEAAEARAKNPHYENRPLYENYFHPWNVEIEPHQ